MPWKVSGVVERRSCFVKEYLTEEWTMAELCRRHGISRQAGYELMGRYEREGWKAVAERSRASHTHPNQTTAEMETAILQLRRAHMSWGARKLKAYLERQHRQSRWPAASTMGEILGREGLLHRRGKRRRTPAYGEPFRAVDGPNRVWCADFKGWFRTGDGERIDPLTISDAHSRYLLRCQAVEKTDGERVQRIFEAVFREYGMPEAVRTDNGAPFATCALSGLSRLSIWWLKLGIVAERIAAGHPEQNGRHERMHRTLKQETAQPPASHRRAQQQRFDEFRQEYNHLRPHEALGMETPDRCYTPSPRAYPVRVPEFEYHSGLQVRRVQDRGEIRWCGHKLFLSYALIGEALGVERVEDRCCRVWLGPMALAEFDPHNGEVRKLKPTGPGWK